MNIDKHIDDVLAIEAPAGISANQFKLWNICRTYQAVRPVLKFAKGLLFFKPKWQGVMTMLMAALDEACPTTNE